MKLKISYEESKHWRHIQNKKVILTIYLVLRILSCGYFNYTTSAMTLSICPISFYNEPLVFITPKTTFCLDILSPPFHCIKTINMLI